MPKALIVDDDTGLTTALAVRLRSAGFEAFTANCADDASTIALRERPNVILLDIDMPVYSGLEFQACLKFSDRGRRIPVIILSGLDSDINRRTAYQQGAAAFVSKPFEWPSLLDTIHSVLTLDTGD